MDGQRFDSFAKAFAAKVSRRAALRSGAGLAAGLLALTGLGVRPATSQTQPRYVVTRRYALTGSAEELRRGLRQGLEPLLRQAPGFVEFYAVVLSNSAVETISVFDGRTDTDASAKIESDWIAQNAASLLKGPPQVGGGQVFYHAIDAGRLGAVCPGTATATPVPTEAPCGDPARPGVGCPCQTGTRAPCGQTDLLCCATTNRMGSPGVCTSPAVDCAPIGPTAPPTAPPTGTAGPAICTDPNRPGVGCPCDTGTAARCGDSTLVCCATDSGRPGGPGVCTPAAVGCDPIGPTVTPTPPPCTRRGCRCNGGVQGACDGDLVCCPSNPGLAGGPGHCLPAGVCNGQGCTSEGCACNSGVRGACDGGLICCADDSSLPGGPGRCETEAVCHEHQCQATTNPCPSDCAAGAYCDGCCSGHCQDDGHCGHPACTGEGCECTGGVQGACDAGLVCCQRNVLPGGTGHCTRPHRCRAGDPGTDAVPTAPADATAAPDVTPAPIETAVPARRRRRDCADEGCRCNSGVEAACGDGLVCCADNPGVPGGPGHCVQDGTCQGDSTGTGTANATATPTESAPPTDTPVPADTPVPTETPIPEAPTPPDGDDDADATAVPDATETT